MANKIQSNKLESGHSVRVAILEDLKSDRWVRIFILELLALLQT